MSQALYKCVALPSPQSLSSSTRAVPRHRELRCVQATIRARCISISPSLVYWKPHRSYAWRTAACPRSFTGACRHHRSNAQVSSIPGYAQNLSDPHYIRDHKSPIQRLFPKIKLPITPQLFSSSSQTLPFFQLKHH